MNKKMIGIIVVVIICVGIFTAINISKDKGNVAPTYSNKIEKENNTKNEISNELNNETSNNTEDEKETNTINEEKTENEKIDTSKDNQNTETNENKAKRIVKSDWGEDDSIYYSYDGLNSNGDCIICVRDKATTKALCWYHVNVENETFEIKY